MKVYVTTETWRDYEGHEDQFMFVGETHEKAYANLMNILGHPDWNRRETIIDCSRYFLGNYIYKIEEVEVI